MRRRVFAVTFFVVPFVVACELGSYPCGATHAVCKARGPEEIGYGYADFDTACAGGDCGIVVENGSYDVVDSFLPGDHALRLQPGTTLTIPLVVGGYADGAEVSVNGRCDPGGTLSFFGDGLGGSLSQRVVATSETWTRYQVTLRTPTHLVPYGSDPSAGQTSVKLRFSSSGSAPCTLDRVVERTSALVCSDWEMEQSTCTGTPPWEIDSGSSSSWSADTGSAWGDDTGAVTTDDAGGDDAATDVEADVADGADAALSEAGDASTD